MDPEVRNALILAARAEKAKTDPWYFFHFLKTHDEHDPDADRKPFPRTVILRVACRFFRDYDLGFIEKSRQIMMSWTMCGLFLWDAVHKPNRRHFFRDTKEEAAAAKVDRARFMLAGLLMDEYPNLPKIKMVGDKVGTGMALTFLDTNSSITAVAQGSGQAAGYTTSGIFDDEINLQPDAEDGYGTALPTVKGGGKYMAVGTPYGHTFGYRMMYGIDPNTNKPMGKHRIDSTKIKKPKIAVPSTGDKEADRYAIERALLALSDEDFDALPFEELVACCPGLKYWKTCDGVDVLSIHYSADPTKSKDTRAGRKWIKEEKVGTTKASWNQHYELNYKTVDGRPVISNWRDEIFVRDVDYDHRRPLLLSLDFGKNCGCAFAQEETAQGFTSKRINIIDEIYLEGSNTIELLREVLEKLNGPFRSSWDSNNLRVYCDPAGHQERETTADKSQNSSIKILNSGGLFPETRKFGVPESTQQVEAIFSMMLPDGLPAVLVHPRCEYLISCFDGGWAYPKEKGREGYPMKDGHYEHGGDFTRYLLCNRFDPSDMIGAKKPNRHRGQVVVREEGTGRIKRIRNTPLANHRNRGRGKHAVRA